MDFLGIGPLEIAVIFLVAFLALGPGKSIEMARNAGKFLRDLRRTFDEVASSISLDDTEQKPSQQSDSTRPPQPPPTSARPFEPSSSAPTSEDESPRQNPP